MRQKLRELLLPQPKAKIKAGDGMNKGKYKFFTSSAAQSKYYFSALYNQPALIFGTGGAASVHFCKEPFSTSTDCLVMYGTEETNLEMIFYYLRTHMHILQAGFKGAGLQHISKEYILDIEVDLPGIDIQAKIVEQNRLLDRLISSRNTQCDLLDKAVKSRFLELFGGYPEIQKLSGVAVVTGGLTKHAKRDKLDLKKPYLRVANVSFATIDTTEMLDIGLTLEEYTKTLLKEGDLLFVEGNGSPGQVGRVAVWHNEVADCVHQNHIIKARFDLEKMSPVFAMYYFISERGRKQIELEAVSTSGLYTLSVSKIARFKIPIPPLALQQRFAAFVTQVDKSKYLEGLEVAA